MVLHPKVGEIRTYDVMPLQIVAVADKFDTLDTVVVLAKSALINDNYHEVWEITPNATEARIRVTAHTGEQMMSSAEQALQDWADRAFGVNLF